MYKVILSIIVILFLIKDFFLFPYVKKNLLQQNTCKKGNAYFEKADSDEITLFFPGNAMSVYNLIPYLKNKNYILINYRPKKSDGYFYGFTNRKIALENALDAYNYASKNYKKIHIITFSIGNGVFSDLLIEIINNNLQYPTSLTSIAGLPNLYDVINSLFSIPIFINKILFPYFETEDIFCKYLRIPYLMVHGINDVIIPFNLAKKMYKSIKEKNDNTILHILHFEGHNNINIAKYL